MRCAQPPALRSCAAFKYVRRRSGRNMSGAARFYFYTNALKFTAEFIGRIALLDGFAQLIGAPQCFASEGA